MSKKIIITGASGGFGKLMTLAMIKEGHAVAATMRGVEGKNQDAAEELKKAGAHIFELDVTSNESVQSGVNASIDAMGGVDVLINNAGVGMIGLQETFTPEDWMKLFDINVFGMQRTARAVLPKMREKKDGLLIFISSLLGRMTLPFYGPYNASKWAVEAMAENYRAELSAFGIESSLIEPGGFPTAFFNALMKPSDTSQDASYGDMTKAPMELFNAFEGALSQNPVQKPELVAEAAVKLIATPKGEKPMRVTVDAMGMGAAIDPLNEQSEGITKAIYGNFAMDGMLSVQK